MSYKWEGNSIPKSQALIRNRIMKPAILLLLLIGLISCQKDEPQDFSGMLRSVSYISDDFPEYTFSIQYKSDLKIDKITHTLNNSISGYWFYRYNSTGNLTSVEDEYGIVDKWYYYNSNHQLIKTVDGSSKDSTLYEYDGKGQVILRLERYWYTRFEYDANGNRVSYKFYNYSDSLLAELYNLCHPVQDPMRIVKPYYFDLNLVSQCYSKPEYERSGSVSVTGRNTVGEGSNEFPLFTSTIEYSGNSKIWSIHKVFKNGQADMRIQFEFY
jgi:YD repeat-containing protein